MTYRMTTREKLAKKLTDMLNEDAKFQKHIVYPESLFVNKGNRQMNGVASWHGVAYFENSRQVSKTFFSFASMADLLKQDSFKLYSDTEII